LCNGKRGFVIVDKAGTPHSLPRRLGIKANQVRSKLADLDPADFPSVSEVQSQINNYQKRIKKMKDKKQRTFSAENSFETKSKKDLQAILEFWKKQGVEPYIHQNEVWFMYLNCLWQDGGDRITLHCEGEPTDKQIEALVKAGKEKGWGSIRFFGGSEEYQHRARAEALKQGYPAEKISIECEEGSGRKAETSLPENLPDYLRDAILNVHTPDENIPEDNINQSLTI
jgi:hypothetical protein